MTLGPKQEGALLRTLCLENLSDYRPVPKTRNLETEGLCPPRAWDMPPFFMPLVIRNLWIPHPNGHESALSSSLNLFLGFYYSNSVAWGMPKPAGVCKGSDADMWIDVATGILLRPLTLWDGAGDGKSKGARLWEPAGSTNILTF